MSENALAPVFSVLGWAFLPGYATSILQSFYYKLTIPVGRAPPQPGTPLFAKHHRRIRILVLTLYLAYTLLQSLYDIKLAGDFYTYLSVTPTTTSDRDIKSRFRRLAAKYHPDKIRTDHNNAASNHDFDTSNASSTDSRFLLLKLAQDTLLNPSLRFAYNRFGPGITTYAVNTPNPAQNTIRAYVLSGLRHNILPSYLMNIISLVVLNYIWLPKWGAYWRYLILSGIAVLEIYFLTHNDADIANLLPSYLIPLTSTYNFLQTRTKLKALLPPHLLPFQIMSILRKLSISLNIFISQLAPPKNPRQVQAMQSGDSNSGVAQVLKGINQSLAHIHQVAVRTDGESTSLLTLQTAPYKGDAEKTQVLRDEMRDGMILGAMRNQPEVREAVKNAAERHRTRQST